MTEPKQPRIEEEIPIENISDIEFHAEEFNTPFSLKRFSLLAVISLIVLFAIEVYFAYNRMFPDVQETILESTGSFITFAFSGFIIIPTLSVFLVCCLAMVGMSQAYFSNKTQEHLNKFSEKIKENNEINKKNVAIANKRSIKFKEVVAEKDKKIKELETLVATQNATLERTSHSATDIQQEIQDLTQGCLRQLTLTADRTAQKIETLHTRALTLSHQHTKEMGSFLQDLSELTKYKALNAKLANDLKQANLKAEELQTELNATKSRRTEAEESQAAGLAALRRLLRATEHAAEKCGIPKPQLRKVRKELLDQKAHDRC